MRNLEDHISTNNSTYDIKNWDENSIACRMNPVENYADFENFEDFIESNSIFSEEVDCKELEDILEDFKFLKLRINIFTRFCPFCYSLLCSKVMIPYISCNFKLVLHIKHNQVT